MLVGPLLGVLLHAIGGLAAASFYVPLKGVRGWKWETAWLINGIASWVIVPFVVAMLTVPDLLGVLREAPAGALWWSYFFGLLWGVGGLTFGLSVRYLGLSLGYALALGFCAAFGTLIPPIFFGTFDTLLATNSGRVIVAGVVVCLLGIAICGAAGMRKERETVSDEAAAERTAKGDFSFMKGLWVAIFAGVMSACMAFALTAGAPINESALAHGTSPIWQGMPTLVVVLVGGFTTNVAWCLFLGFRNRSYGDYTDTGTPLLLNYLLAALAGTIWYLQFMFYQMGTTQLGEAYDFSSWTVHMAFIIVFSNLWGLALREWGGTSARTRLLIWTGILVLIGSTVVVGVGNYIADPVPADAAEVEEATDVIPPPADPTPPGVVEGGAQ